MTIRRVFCFLLLCASSERSFAQHFDYVIRNSDDESATADKPFTCPDPNPANNCSCMYASNDFEIQCPVVNPEITVKIKPQSYAQIQCYDRQDLSVLPSFKVGNTTQLKIIHCPLPGDKSIRQLVSFLGVEHVTDFWYQNYGKQLDVQLVRSHFNGMEDLEKLFLSAGLEEIPVDLFVDLPNLKWLILRGNNIKFLDHVFDNLASLVILELGANQISELSPGLFQKQKQLRHLSLWHNNLRDISKDTFRGAHALEELDLSVNSLKSLNSDVFSELPELTSLNLGLNQFTNLPSDLLSENNKLSEFKLINNRVPLELLPGELFSNLPLLKTVTLSHCGIAQLSASLFFGSSDISTIDLSYNQLRTLPGRLLRDQYWLQELNLAFNMLEVLPDQVFQYTGELTTLNLSFNRLRNLTGRIFSSLDKLTELHLNNNLLHSIDQLTFSGTGNLVKLYLHNNELGFHDSNQKSPFQYLNNLRILNLRNNSVTTLLHDWNYNTFQLRELDLRNNKISSLSYLNLHFISRDIRIDLSNNRISQIDMINYQDPMVSTRRNKTGKIWVNVNQNPLICNCHSFTFVRYLQSPQAAFRRIRFAADNLLCSAPEHLSTMQASQVPPEKLLCAFDQPFCPAKCTCFHRPLDQAIIINCSGQGLTQIPKLPLPSALGYSFIELHVEDNNISKLPEVGLDGYKDVAELYANNNSITRLHSENIPGRIRILDLTGNRLVSLDYDAIYSLNTTHRLDSLLLANNRWRCSCDTRQFLAFVQHNFRMITDSAKMSCDNGKQLISISNNDLCAELWVIIFAFCFSLLLLGLLIFLFVATFLTYETEIKAWLFKHNLLLFWVSEQELDKEKHYDAFISYSHRDEEFVTERLIPTLEKPPMNFSLCWHVRDWLPGELIAQQITKSINESRRTIVVLSKGFLESVWARMEFRTAHLNSIAEKRTRVIVIIYEDIGSINELDADLKAYLKMNTYIRWGDPWFWNKLRYAMPHPPKVRTAKKKSAKSYHIADIENQLAVAAKPQLAAADEFTGYMNPAFSRSLGTALDQVDCNTPFGDIENSKGKYISCIISKTARESEV